MITDFAGQNDQANGVVVQADGKVVATGFAYTDTANDFALARYLTDGTLDTSFDGDGKLTTDFGTIRDEAHAITIQPDGKIVAGGYALVNGHTLDFALARYMPNDTLDPAFDGDGKVTTDLGGGGNETPLAIQPSGVAIQSDGTIVAAGCVINAASRYDFALVRYMPNGALDTRFGTNGKITTDFGNNADDVAGAVAIQSDGKIVEAGRTIVNNIYDFAVARYQSSSGGPPAPTATPTPTLAPGQFYDVPPDSTFYPFVTCLVNRNVISGYTDGTFRPQNNVTRGQLSKIVALAAGYSDPPGAQTFEDIAPGSTFYTYIQQLSSRGVIGGYSCGGAGEPCVAPGNLPYFRPNGTASRGQTSKIVAIAKGLPAPPAGQQSFQDVAVGSTFWQWIEALSTQGAIGGYPCGGAGEPCVSPGNKPYFRPSGLVTRGQSSKIVANTFFPNCQPATFKR